MHSPTDAPAGTWRQLLSGRYLGTATVLAGGVALYATNVYLTTSLLPTAIDDIGGQQYYAWTATVFLIASVISSMLVTNVLAARGPRGAYLIGLAIFALGTVVCAVSPTMELLLVGRTIQGSGGGLLAGLGYAVINAALPQTSVDSRGRAGFGDVGSRHLRRPCNRRCLCSVRSLAMGFRRPGHRDDRSRRSRPQRATGT